MLKRVKKWLAFKLFPFVTRHAPESVQGYVQERALEAAVPVVMAAMESAGLVHCAMCPNRRGPFRNVGPYKACPKHVKDLEARWAAEQAAQKAAA